MEITNVLQHINIMFISLVFGAAAAFIFDLGRFFIKLLNFGSIGESIFELIFWALAALTVFNIYLTNFWGEIRLYNLAIIFLGFYLYKAIFSKKIINILVFIKSTIIQVLNVCLYPFLWLKQK
ncbi:MAG TPA: hypothetical protein GXZ31_01865 [Thermoanaerobacterales bacterium]|nr:hypothetical protein [Thermoanaerobacterales bacterium]